LGRTVNCATSRVGVAGKGVALVVLGALFLFSAVTSDAQLLHKKKKVNKSTSADNNAQPDKILYDRAIDDIKHGKQEVGRLNMQTLINTYPDSEYLAKAKLAIADSYYKESGTSNLALAISGYKDFIIFFPFLPEATYAQMQVAMAHYKQMEKPDRDRTHARAAEDEFQTFLQKYPNDPLAPQAQQHLREVQEVLAEGDYRIGYYYYVKGDKRAAAARLLAVTNRYPLYSKSDRALWMMGDILEKSEHKEVAALYYAKIVRNYPLSGMVPGAKDKLKAFGAPVPQADPTAVAWMTAEQNAPRPHTSLVKKPLTLISNGPKGELFTAARNGTPNLQPESDSMSTSDILTPGGQSKLGGTGLVATITPGVPGTAETTGTSETVAPPAGEAAASDGAVAAPTAASPDAAKNPPAAEGTTETPAKADAATGTDAKSEGTAAGAETKSDGTDAAKTDGSQNSGDPKKESSSKKKKGLRKIVPW
jgi:outer membrane protein assembly factor BamD